MNTLTSLWLHPLLAPDLCTEVFIFLCEPNNLWISDLAEICLEHLRVPAMSPALEMFLWMWSQLIQATQHWLLFCSLVTAQNWGNLWGFATALSQILQFSSFLALEMQGAPWLPEITLWLGKNWNKSHNFFWTKRSAVYRASMRIKWKNRNYMCNKFIWFLHMECYIKCVFY